MSFYRQKARQLSNWREATNLGTPNQSAFDGVGTEIKCAPLGQLPVMPGMPNAGNLAPSSPIHGPELQQLLGRQIKNARVTGGYTFLGETTLLHACLIKWAVARADWVNLPGNGSYVVVWPCENSAGANPKPLDEMRVYLPRPTAVAALSPAKDPNVRTGDVIAYVGDINCNPTAVGNYLDEPIGTMKMWTKTGTLPAGWVIMDGTANASPGSGINMTDKFPMGHATTPATTGGSTTHTHNGHLLALNVLYSQAQAGVGQAVVTDVTMTGDQSHNSANHLPPYATVRFIERLN